MVVKRKQPKWPKKKNKRKYESTLMRKRTCEMVHSFFWSRQSSWCSVMCHEALLSHCSLWICWCCSAIMCQVSFLPKCNTSPFLVNHYNLSMASETKDVDQVTTFHLTRLEMYQWPNFRWPLNDSPSYNVSVFESSLKDTGPPNCCCVSLKLSS